MGKEINEKEKAEEELKILNTQLNEAQEIAKMGHWQWHIASNKVTWSNGLFKIYGFPPKDNGLTYEEMLSRIHPEDKAFVNRTIQESLIRKVLPPYTYRILLDDGSVRTVQAKGEIISDNEDKVVKIIGTAQSILSSSSLKRIPPSLSLL